MYSRFKKTIYSKLKSHPVIFLVLITLVLLLPQLVSQNMISGSDSVFHFNRFYDAAMQIKEGNYQPFISLYGFQQSGRIVNAVYSPYLAYLMGGILLLSQTWFNFQVVSNLVLYLVSGFSMYYLLRRLEVRIPIRVTISCVYLTTFAVQYWITRQGFSSWGAAILPLCLIPIIKMVNDYDINVLELGFFTALMFQVHFLSTLFLMMIYVPFFIYAFVRTREKFKMVGKTIVSIIIFFLLTLNLWGNLWQLYSNNQILAPFINYNMAEATITYQSFYCLFTPFFLFFIMITTIRIFFKFRTSLTPFLQITISTGIVFLVLSSNLIPWTFLLSENVKIAQLIQFPFRFVIPAIFLFLLAMGLLLNNYDFKELKIFSISKMIGFAVLQTLILQIVLLTTWSKPEDYIFSVTNTYLTADSPQEIKESFYSKDLSLALTYIQKSTPDYLPVYENYEATKYKLYKAQVIDLEEYFGKEIEKDKLLVKWVGEDSERAMVPIVGYKNTSLILNGERLTADEVQHSQIGIIKVLQQKGPNVLEVSYTTPKFVTISIFLPPAVIVCCLIFLLSKKIFYKVPASYTRGLINN